MPAEKISYSSYFINLLFFLYFAVLLAERLQSIVRAVKDSEVRLFTDGFNRYVYSLALISISVSVLYLLITNRYFFVGLFTRDAGVYARINMGALCVAAGILLLSGMVHTEYTIAPIQFGAYGALIVAMIIQTVKQQGSSDNRLLLWFSLIYLTAFSMAIPVVYRSELPSATVFHVVEAVTSVVLVVAFTLMLRQVMTADATNLFYILPILAAAIGDSVTLILRWREEVNTFVLIFLIVACVLWCIGKVLSMQQIRQ